MSDIRNKELMQYFDKKFEGIDKKFEALKAEIDTAKEETMRHTGVLIEEVRHDIKILAEGIMTANEKTGREKEENKQEHVQLEKRILINTADISSLDNRVGRLEGKI